MALGLDGYLGIDVMSASIAVHRARRGSATRRFMALDLTREAPPRADAIFCHDLLTHPGYDEIRHVLANFRRSGARGC